MAVENGNERKGGTWPEPGADGRPAASAAARPAGRPRSAVHPGLVAATVVAVIGAAALILFWPGPTWSAPPGPLPSLPATAKPTVLLLASYARDFSWTRESDRGVEESFGDSVILVHEYLDAKRRADAAHLDAMEALFRGKYGPSTFDLVIASDNVALQFLDERAGRLFPGAPVVFCGINDWNPSLAARLPRHGGVLETVDYAGSVDMAMRLYPGLRRVLLFADHGSGGRTTAKDARRDIGAAFPDLELVDAAVAPLAGAVGAVAAMASEPGSTVVLLLSYVTDASGVAWPAELVARAIDEGTGLPIFTSHDAFFQPPVIGGFMVRSYDQGRAAAEIAKGILAGPADAPIPIREDGTPGHPLVSWPALRAAGKDPRDLPPGAVLVGKPTSVAQREPLAVSLVATLLVIMAASSASLYLLWSRTRKARLESERSAASFRAMFENLPVGAALNVLVRDASGRPVDYRLLGVNPAYSRVLGIPVERAAGRLASGVYGGPMLLDRWARLAESGATEKLSTDLGGLEIEVTAYGAEADGFVTIFEDVTERRKAERAVAEAEERYRMAVDATNDVIWDWDIQTGTMFLSPRWYELTGYSPSELPSTYDSWAALVHPDDVGKAIGYVRRRASKGQVYSNEYRILTRDRRTVWIAERGRVVAFDAAGHPRRVVGSFTDVTERRQARERLESSGRRYQALFDTMAQGAIYQGRDGRIADANEAAARMLGVTRTELLERGGVDATWDIVDAAGKPIPPEEQPAMRAVRSGRRESGLVGVRKAPDGKRRWLVVDAIPSPDYGEDPAGPVFATFTDVTEIHEARGNLAESAAGLSAKNRELEDLAGSLSRGLADPVRTLGESLARLAACFGSRDADGFRQGLDMALEAADRMARTLADADARQREPRNPAPTGRDEGPPAPPGASAPPA